MGVSPSYIELHCHSHFSLREGASSIDELVLRARELGYEALALTDHDALYGAFEFSQTARAWGLRPILGSEVTLRDGAHLTLLVENARGYANLSYLLSRAHLDSERDDARLDPVLLSDYHDGLIALSGCRRGNVPRLVERGHYAEAAQVARQYQHWFGPDHFFLELQQNLVFGDTARNLLLAELGEQLGIGLVATNNVHYHVRERHRLHDVLVAVRHRSTLDASHRQRRPNAEFYLKPPQEMAQLFAAYPEAVANAGRIADRCRFAIERELPYRFPDFQSPDGGTPDEYLERLCREAMARKYTTTSAQTRLGAEERLAGELRLVRKHGLAGFFLTYRELLVLAGEVAAELRGRDPALPPDERPVGRGRGSSVSSIICYLIGLSHVDPVKANLFIGRFLNEALESVPDIDIDLPRDIRDELIRRVHAHYGHDHVALVCTFATYRLRSAIRDVGKALGLPPASIDKLAKSSEGYGSARQVAEEMRRLPELRDAVEAPGWRDLVALASDLAGFPRHVSQHPGGLVLSGTPLMQSVPVEPARMVGRYLVQWDKDSVADARFIKIDFLSLGMLAAVDDCLRLIEESTGRRIDLGRIDYNDQAVYDQICAGDTIGVFQIESRAQIQTLPRTQPRTLEDLAVEVAIVRPGPIIGGAFRPYMAERRRLREPNGDTLPGRPQYVHPGLKDVLDETLGVILFQEQVLQVAMMVAGFNVEQAESLRRAMSRKRSREALGAHWPAFLLGALARGISETDARAVFEQILGFAAYGFPKSHAVAFALLAYEAAYLRHYYPSAYYCSLFNSQPMGFYAPAVLVGDARRHGVRVLSPDANTSLARCSLEDGSVRLGLTMVRGLGLPLAEAIVIERMEHGSFHGLPEFSRRVQARCLAEEAAGRGLGKTLQHLILSGAFDAFGMTRRELLWQAGLFQKPHGRQLALPLPTRQDELGFPPLRPWDQLLAEYATLDLSPDLHPMGLIRPHLGERVVTSAHLSHLPRDTRVTVAGLVTCRQRPAAAKGVTFLSLEDEYGLSNVVIYPALYERYRAMIRLEPFLLVQGILQKSDGVANVVAEQIMRLAVPGDSVTPPARNFG